MSYAEKTKVPIDRSQAEIKKILTKYGASAFLFGESSEKALVQFEMTGRRIKFVLPLSVHGVSKQKRGFVAAQSQVDQVNRSKWRSLALAIKAKLECVESGITSLEQEFMAHILLPNGSTVGEVVIPEIATSYQNGHMTPLLGMRE